MSYRFDPGRILARLPHVRGRLVPNADLARLTWFRVGGPAEVLFSPADEDDLAVTLAGLSADVPVQVVGVGSNLLVRDGGLPGLTIRLGRGFNRADTEDERVSAGASALDAQVAKAAAQAGIAGLEFLRGVPGSIGGAVRMNAGCYGTEMKDRLAAVRLVTRAGDVRELPASDLAFSYRHTALPEGAIVTGATFCGTRDARGAIEARMAALVEQREASQPVKERTSGSTFRNPAGHSTTDGTHMPLAAWKLIDAAGCRGLRMGGAEVSQLHCNFLINTGKANAAELEALGEEVRRRVRENSGHDLIWEIQRIGLRVEEVERVPA